MSSTAGISASGRSELTRVLYDAGRFVTPDNVVAALGIDRTAAAQRLARWAEDGWLRRVRRGLYIPVPVDATDPSGWSETALAVANVVWSPCYFTGWTAANHWGLTEQVFRTVALKTSRRVRSTAVRMLDQDYLITHVSEANMSWGLATLWLEEVRLRIADPTRTVIDILDAPHLGGGVRHAAEILDAYLHDYEAAALVEYGDRLGNRAVFKRMGYLLEAMHWTDSRLVDACRERVSAGISLLDPDAPNSGARSMRWGLRINVRLNPVDAT